MSSDPQPAPALQLAQRLGAGATADISPTSRHCLAGRTLFAEGARPSSRGHTDTLLMIPGRSFPGLQGQKRRRSFQRRRAIRLVGRTSQRPGGASVATIALSVLPPRTVQVITTKGGSAGSSTRAMSSSNVTAHRSPTNLASGAGSDDLAIAAPSGHAWTSVIGSGPRFRTVTVQRSSRLTLPAATSSQAPSRAISSARRVRVQGIAAMSWPAPKAFPRRSTIATYPGARVEGPNP